MSEAVKEFVERARGVAIAAAAARLGLKFRPKGVEHPQPCPACGGKDRFSFNTQKNAWNCRGAGEGGKDAIGMAAHVRGLDLHRRAEFLEACSLVTAEEIPADGERETEEQRAAREKRIAEQQAQNAAEAAKREKQQFDFREAERNKARGILTWSKPIAGSAAADYLGRRGAGVPPGGWLRFSPDQTYWHGTDETGRPASLFSGPAMLAHFIDASGEVIGCHITWIDLGMRPKFRPLLYGLTAKGREAGRPEWRLDIARQVPTLGDLDRGFYEQLPTKKMRGSKKGGLIPLCGDPFTARRWLGGEGIENGLAFGRWEKFRTDTFYFAAGDLGNLAGPADPSSRFAHPSAVTVDKRGAKRPVMVQGPVPKPDQDAEDAMWIGGQVDELVLLADGDSEPVATAAAMVRARHRLQRPPPAQPRTMPIVWPGAAGSGSDFAAMMADADAAFEME